MPQRLSTPRSFECIGPLVLRMLLLWICGLFAPFLSGGRGAILGT